VHSNPMVTTGFRCPLFSIYIQFANSGIWFHVAVTFNYTWETTGGLTWS
jgi:hypothetical protein